MPGKIAEPNVNIWYVDRSGISIRFDAGVHGPRDNHRESIPMDSLSTVLQAEIMVILRCTQLLLSKNITRRRMHICFDSRAATATLAKTTIESALLWENMQVLEKLCGSNPVTLVRYLGIIEYRKMKKLINWPRKGLMESLLTKLLASPLLWVKSHQQLIHEHLNRWNTYCGCHQSKTLMSELLSSKTRELQAMSRQHLKVAVGLLTGHTTLTALLFKLRLTQRQDCQPVWELKIR